ncbi:MAG: multiheme c-type cytochrome [Candidatus Brocadiaceae bacterium]
MKLKLVCFVCFAILSLFGVETFASEEQPQPQPPNLSNQTQLCLTCHKKYTPGIVEDWLTSRHSITTPEMALKKPVLERRISNENIPETLQSVVVGCYECHSQSPSLHKDNFDHFGFQINVIVSPNDCKTCHSVEVEQYAESKKAHALDNLQNNPVYHTFTETVLTSTEIKGNRIVDIHASNNAKAETCYACHGTKITVNGLKSVSTQLGDIDVPDLSGWPNQGVGRINPDGSSGACTSCHPRHSFSIEIARKPYTCSQCHLEPDVPAFNVYKESKHGNIFASKYQEWNWTNVPWKVGVDFKAPTCATCHNSLLTTPDGKVIAQRTHDFSSRLWVRIFGLPYSHPQPKNGKTYLIKNKDAIPLPTDFLGQPASEYLISKTEQTLRQREMKKVCQACHSTDWTDRHFAKLDCTIAETDKMVLTSTQLLLNAWGRGLADPTNPFDELIEYLWVRQWFVHANSIRFASAMGGPDYATFENGWWELTTTLREIQELVQNK